MKTVLEIVKEIDRNIDKFRDVIKRENQVYDDGSTATINRCFHGINALQSLRDWITAPDANGGK